LSDALTRGTPDNMIKNDLINSSKASGRREERVSTSQNFTLSKAVRSAGPQVIKLGMDVGQKVVHVALQVDDAVPQPAQDIAPLDLPEFIARQLRRADRVIACYEAGCFGYGLQRQLTELGVECLVVAPQNWDDRHKNVRNDRADAKAMVVRLDRYVAGNTQAFSVVRIPTVDEELRRGRSRLRKRISTERHRFANLGKSLLLYHGVTVRWSWWKPNNSGEVFERAKEALGPKRALAVLSELKYYHDKALEFDRDLWVITAELKAWKAKVQKSKKAKEAESGDVLAVELPPMESRLGDYRIVGIGELSWRLLCDEVMDWSRFNNRRQAASYSGLCGGVIGTGGKSMNLGVTKHGNRRLRALLVDLAWGMYRYQPSYRPIVKWNEVIGGRNRTAAKKAIVAVARQLMVDLWRIETGRTTPEALGLRTVLAREASAA
jgi:transposase